MLLASTALAKSDLAYAAVAGTVTLTGGEAGTHYSDKATFNIVSISVADADVSPERSGVARFITPNTQTDNIDGCENFPLNGTAIPTTCGSVVTDVTPAILAGEVSKTDTFTATNAQTVFVLTLPGRDADDNAGLTISDVVVTVDGTVTAAASVQTTKTDGSAAGNNGATLATRIVSVTMGTGVATGKTVTVQYETSEYDQATPANTPFLTGISDMSINVGGSAANLTSANYNPTAATPVGLIDPSTGIVSSNTKLDYNVVKISFKYEVLDTLTDLIKVSTPTSTALNKDRTLTAAESGAATDAYTTSVALFSSADYAIIEKEVNRASCDNAGVAANTTVTELDVCLDTATGSTALATRVVAANTSLGNGDASGSAASLLARIIPVADGETLTVSYTDASPAATVSATATLDMTAPTITLVQPTTATSTNNTTPTLEVQVTDTGAGVTSSTIDLALGDVDKNAVASPITNGFRITFVPSAELAEASYEWNVIKNGDATADIADDVGNTPATTVVGSVTTPFTFNVDKTAATLSTAVTGTGEASRATDATTLVVTVTEEANASAVKITFDDGDGNAKIDATTVTISDITIGGTNPASVTVNDNVIYAVMATALDSAATPKVEIAGSISDAAGNATTTGDVTATDGIVPTLTITTDVSVTKEKVVITVTSSENLLVAPEIFVATIGTASLTATATSSTVYTATATTTTSEVHTISVNAVDIASNNVKVQVTDEDISAAVRTAADAESDDALDVATVITLAKANIVDSTGDGQITLDDIKTGCGATLTAAKADAGDSVSALVSATLGTIKLHANQVTGGSDSCAIATAAHSWVATYAYTASTATFEGDVALAAPVLKPNADTDDTSPHIIIDFSAEATEYTSDANSKVTISKATLDGVDISASLQTSDNGKFVYLASGLAVGDHTIVVNAADVAGNVLATDASQTFKVIAEAETSIALSPGLNLVSFSGATKSTAFSDVFSNSTINSVLTYDPSVPGNWLSATLNSATAKLEGPLSERTVDEDLAYWVDSSSYDPIKVVIPAIGFGSQSLPPSIDVVKGYNYVAIATINSATTTVSSETYLGTITWTRGYVFNATTQAYTTVTSGTNVTLNVGDGIIVYASAAGVIVP
jgi:hypothetical protein